MAQRRGSSYLDALREKPHASRGLFELAYLQAHGDHAADYSLSSAVQRALQLAERLGPPVQKAKFDTPLELAKLPRHCQLQILSKSDAVTYTLGPFVQGPTSEKSELSEASGGSGRV